MWVIGSILTAITVVVVIGMIGIGYVVYRMMDKPRVADARDIPPELQDYYDLEDLDDVPLDEIVNQLGSQNQIADTGLVVDFRPGVKHSYFYNLDIEINQDKLSYHGINTITAATAHSPNAQIGADAQRINYSALMFTSEGRGFRTSLTSSRPDSSRGNMMVDKTGDYFSDKDDEMVPFLAKPMGLIGVERLSSHQKSWTVVDEIILTDVEEAPVNSDPLARYRSRRSPVRQSRPRVSVTVLRRSVDYQILSNRGDEIKVSKRLRIEPSNTGGISVTANGTFVYNRKLKLVKNSEMTGRARVTEGAITFNVPFSFKVNHKSEEEMLTEKKESEKRRAAAAAKRNTTRPTNDKSGNPGKAASFTDNSVTDLGGDVVGKINDVRWGAKGLQTVNRNGKDFLVLARFDSKLQVFDWKTQRMTDQREVRSLSNASKLAVSPNGEYVIYGGNGGGLQAFQISDRGNLVAKKEFIGHNREIKMIDIAPDNQTVVSGDSDKKIRVWDLTTGKESHVFKIDWYPSSAKFSKDMKSIQVSDCRHMYVINLETEKVESKTKIAQNWGSTSAFSNDGLLYAHVEGTDSIRIMDAKTLEEVAKLKCDVSFPKNLYFSPDSKQLYWGVHGFAYVYTLANEKTTKFKVDKTFGLETLSFSSDQQQCAIGSRSHIVFMRRPDK